MVYSKLESVPFEKEDDSFVSVLFSVDSDEDNSLLMMYLIGNDIYYKS